MKNGDLSGNPPYEARLGHEASLIANVHWNRFNLGLSSIRFFILWPTAEIIPPRCTDCEGELAYLGGAGGEVGDGYARFRYVLRNEGDSPVRIHSIRASCGCAKPSVSPTEVAPGGTTIVSVAALQPAIGELLLQVTLDTDSPSNPFVTLTARVLSAQRPPFVMGASGDLTFFDDDLEEGTGREIVVRTIETSSKPVVPPIETDLSFLEIEFVSSSERPAPLAGAVERTHVYRTRFNKRPPPGTFDGLIGHGQGPMEWVQSLDPGPWGNPSPLEGRSQSSPPRYHG